ncbi:MAG: stage V sporulation protein AB [Eubacteriales bacterium]|nr:stage V sporulation protein AB [Eubacteriales bacterium]
MVILRQALLAFTGLGAGILVSAGVFTVLLSVGLVPRFAGQTHTGDKIFLYEEMVVAGTLSGSLLSLFAAPLRAWQDAALWTGTALWQGAAYFLQAAFGLFSGVFVGCLALAIAEMLDSVPILTRRIRFRRGLGLLVLSVALGKLFGSLLYFGLRKGL